jgi:3-oxoacyl-[acyl-carrier protein] reductase
LNGEVAVVMGSGRGIGRAAAEELAGEGARVVDAVAHGVIATWLTAVTTDAQSIDVDGREITVGIDPVVHEAATAQIALGRAGTVGEAAGAVYLLCSPESSYITGQTLVCSGGL